MAATTITDADLMKVLRVVEQAEPADGSEQFYSAVLVGLRELVPCDDITFQLMDVAGQRVRLLTVTDHDGGRHFEAVCRG